jgi:ubiquinone/menaquinone biosynthesis C-methylase UbiE
VPEAAKEAHLVDYTQGCTSATPDGGDGASVLRWPIPEELRQSEAVRFRNGFAEQLAPLDAQEMVKRYAELSIEQFRQLLHEALRRTGLGVRGFHGTGVELGAGCAALGSLVASLEAVSRVYAVEICWRMAELVQPKVARAILGNRADKLVPCAGSFDDLQLPDAAVDFAVEYDSLHHSNDLCPTLREVSRVLKPGGNLLCFDRCHPDSVSDAQVEKMLNRVYSEEFLHANGYPPGIRLTRRQNGEHEYRLREWKHAFESAGLRLASHVEMWPRIAVRKGIRGAFACVPEALRRRAGIAVGARWEELVTFVAQQLGLLAVVPRRTTLFLVTRE